MKNIIYQKQGFFQAVGIALYCSFIGAVMWNGDKVFGKMNNFLGPIFMLLLFSTSALICGSIVFYKPYKLFLKGKGTDAANVVIGTAFWLIVLLLVLFLVLFIGKR